MFCNYYYFFLFSVFTFQEMLDMLFEIEDEYPVEEIFIESPYSNIFTDEDLSDEDGAGTIDNLTGR